jgi:hypothetical protein
MHVSARDKIVPLGIFIDAVYVKEIERSTSTAVITNGSEGVGSFVVIRSSPLKYELAGCDVDFLNQGIPDVTVR